MGYQEITILEPVVSLHLFQRKIGAERRSHFKSNHHVVTKGISLVKLNGIGVVKIISVVMV